MTDHNVLEAGRLGFPWATTDPFLFCVHHLDRYPAGNAAMGIDPQRLRGRNLGMDFEIRDGFRMYHGEVVPGFPRHPHRGFETVTLARQGYIDHADSLGATARFGHGDVQWMTAGRGIEHCEMFPLVDPEGPNTGELFQIWLNLPRERKLVQPAFSMLWGATIPRVTYRDAEDRKTRVTVMAGRLGDRVAPPPPPDSWATDPANEVNIWTIALEPGAGFTIPAASPGVNRTLYFFEGETLTIQPDGAIPRGVGARVRPDVDLRIENGPVAGEVLMLQGRPIGEPVVQHGPFVMNTRQEIQQAFEDYRRGAFGRWPWRGDDPVHPRGKGRFAVHADGRVEDAPA